MSNDEDFQFHDFDRRAKEIIAELTKDGYPDTDQLTIVGGTLAMILAKTAESTEHLAEGLTVTKELIDQGSKMWFKARQKGK